jgi:SAM-dependent methyltransferase
MRLLLTSTAADDLKEQVQTFWEVDPCGSKHASAPAGTREFFAEVERKRYELEPFIEQYAQFEAASGQSVLEVGVGLGTDFVRFARAGAKVTGVDLTERSIELVRERLATEGLEGELMTADAEALPFADGSFDVVYSWGVLHHTPRCDAAIREVLRVVKPGGRVCVMLYARHSWVAFGLWARYALLRGRPWLSLADVVADHMESAGTKAFTRAELRSRFGALSDLSVEHVGTPYDRRVAGPVARATGRRLGWFLVVRGRAPQRA